MGPFGYRISPDIWRYSRNPIFRFAPSLSLSRRWGSSPRALFHVIHYTLWAVFRVIVSSVVPSWRWIGGVWVALIRFHLGPSLLLPFIFLFSQICWVGFMVFRFWLVGFYRCCHGPVWFFGMNSWDVNLHGFKFFNFSWPRRHYPLHPMSFIPDSDMLFACWNSQSFHLHMGGVSRFTTQAMSWTGSFRTFIVHGPWTGSKTVRIWLTIE